jgi:GxxExxY protein
MSPIIRAIRVIRGQQCLFLKPMDDLIHKELSEDIIGAAMKVLNTLKPGLDEKLYENALVIELTKRGHRVDQQRAFPVRYEGQLVGTLIPDLIGDDLVIVDPKVATSFTDTHVAKMTGYLAITGLQLALLLNFKFARLGWKRTVRTQTPQPRND